MTQEQSTNKASLRMLNLLLNKALTRKEIIEKLVIKPVTFFKNLKLLLDAGFRVEKKDRKYKIDCFLNSLEFSEVNLEMMAHLLTLASNVLPYKKAEVLGYVLRKFLYLSDEESLEKFYEKVELFNRINTNNKFHDVLELFEMYRENKTIVEVTTSDLINYAVVPIEYFWKGKSLTFLFDNCYAENRIELDAEKIKKIVPLEKNVSYDKDNRTVTIFELTGRLAKNYLLKKEEFLMQDSDDKILVENYSSDKKTLFKRLLKYQSLCEVILPLEDRKNFKKLIEKSLDNIERFQDNNIK